MLCFDVLIHSVLRRGRSRQGVVRQEEQLAQGIDSCVVHLLCSGGDGCGSGSLKKQVAIGTITTHVLERNII